MHRWDISFLFIGILDLQDTSSVSISMGCPFIWCRWSLCHDDDILCCSSRGNSFIWIFIIFFEVFFFVFDKFLLKLTRVPILVNNEQFPFYAIIILLISIFIIIFALTNMLSGCIAARHLGLLFLFCRQLTLVKWSCFSKTKF